MRKNVTMTFKGKGHPKCISVTSYLTCLDFDNYVHPHNKPSRTKFYHDFKVRGQGHKTNTLKSRYHTKSWW